MANKSKIQNKVSESVHRVVEAPRLSAGLWGWGPRLPFEDEVHATYLYGACARKQASKLCEKCNNDHR